jgi:hypothetical protein
LNFIEENEVSSVQIILSDELVFKDEFYIDNSAKHRWENAAALEIERRSPLLNEYIIAGYGRGDKQDDSSKICIGWVIAHSDNLVPLFKILDDSGVRAYKAFAEANSGGQLEFNLPKKPISYSMFFAGNPLQNSLALTFVLLILVNIFTFDYFQSQRYDQLSSHVEDTKDQAMLALDVLNAIRVLKGIRENSVQAGKQHALGQILDELSEVLDDEVWVVEFRLDGDTIQLSGFGDDPVGIAASLEESIMFSGVRVVNSSSVGGGQSQFNITLHRELEAL